MNNIIASIRKQYPVSDASIQELASCFTLCNFPKKTELIKKGVHCKYVYFIEQGIVKSYWIVNGEEHITSFSTEGCLVFSMDELYYNQVSEEFAETIEEVQAYRITIADLNRLMETNLELCNWGRIIHQNEYRRLHRSHKERLSLPAKERYEAFCEQFPELCNKIGRASCRERV